MTSLKDPEGEKDKYCMISLTCIIQKKTNKKTKLTDTENRRWLPEVRTRVNEISDGAKKYKFPVIK